MKEFKIIGVFILITISTVFISCEDDEPVYSPKPRGYFRIAFPEKSYKSIETDCPFNFEVPTYAVFSNNQRQGDEKCWYNLSYPKFKATVHLSYKPVENNISSYIEDSRNFAVKHQIKATGMNESVIIRDSARVFGLMYDIEGNTASSLQFYITDSTKHFMRGALYFDARTNIDSLKIVIDFIRQDILHLIETASWKS